MDKSNGSKIDGVLLGMENNGLLRRAPTQRELHSKRVKMKTTLETSEE